MKQLFLLVVTVFCSLASYAQKLTVENMEISPLDTYASVNKRVDINGIACAVVRVSLPLADATFSGTNHIGNIDRIGADYIVFMPTGSKKMYIQHPAYHELEVNFEDYGISKLQSVATYRITISLKEGLAVKGFKEVTSDISVRKSPRRDGNGESCALVKVKYPKSGASFDNGVVGDVAYKNGEYWVYLEKGTKRLRIHIPDQPIIIVVFTDYGIAQAEPNVTYSIEFKFPIQLETSFYFQAGMLIGSTMGPEAAIGAYLGGFNIELCALLPMAGEESVYWQSESQAPVEFRYKPSIAFGAKLGYGIMAGKSFRITPQVGVRYMGLTETAVGSTSLTPAKGANSAAVTIGCKLQYMLGKNFGISLTPEYAAAVAKSKGFQALADASGKIKGWNNGIGVKLALNVEF